MRLLIFIIGLLFSNEVAFAQNAAGVIVNTQASPGQVQVQISVSETTGTVSFSTSFNVNFLNSTNQMNADIKQKIRDILLQYGVNVPINNIVIFGGAQ